MYLFRSIGATVLFALAICAPFEATRSPATAATKMVVANASCFNFASCFRNRLYSRSRAASRRAAPRVASRSALYPERNVSVLYAWSGPEGSIPSGNPYAFRGAGYGTTDEGGGTGCGGAGCGTVFMLTPPVPGKTAWTHSLIHAFNGADGSFPQGGVIADGAGALYGTASFGGGGVCNCGTVFKLTPPSLGQTVWTISLLHTFTGTGGDGVSPYAGLVFDKAGALYGTTAFAGTVFKLSPPRSGETTWTESVLHSFVNASDGSFPDSDLMIDGNGALYGTTLAGGGSCVDEGGCGTVYKVTPPVPGRTGWTETLLHVFTGNDGMAPLGGVVADRLGALYVVTGAGGIVNTQKNCYNPGCGSVVKLTAPSSGRGPWNFKVLHLFTGYPNDGGNPYAHVTGDSTGALYGTTVVGGVENQGTVFKLTPPASGTGLWTQKILHSFTGGADGGYSYSPLIDVGFMLYGVTANGGNISSTCPYGCGVAFKIGK